MSKVIHLTPGRCSQCGRFVAHDAEPDVWAVVVAPQHHQVRGQPNIYARTRCDGCRYTSRPLAWTWPVPLTDAEERARLLGEAT